VRDTLQRLAGVASISDRLSAETWTAEIVTRRGRLPDTRALARAVRSAGDPFTLRGVEATIDGCLEDRGGQLALRVSGTRDLLLLAPLRHKVQWDPRLEREQPMTAEEGTAYTRLTAQSVQVGRPVRIVGPLVETGAGVLPTLEVRQFIWDRS
jgi:hypothetical protein